MRPPAPYAASAANGLGAPKVSVVVPDAMRFTLADVGAFARHVEDVGLDGVFAGDRLDLAVPLADSAAVLAEAAAATSRIHIGFGVMVLAMRGPDWAADQVAALQQTSGGRVILGVGLGDTSPGTAAAHAVRMPMAERAICTDAALRTLRARIAGSPPPIWVGGGSRAARRRAALYGDAWFPPAIAPGEISRAAARLAADSTAYGRPDTPTIAAGGAVLLTEPGPRVAEQLAAYAQAGAPHIVLRLSGDEWQRQCELLAEASETARAAPGGPIAVRMGPRESAPSG